MTSGPLVVAVAVAFTLELLSLVKELAMLSVSDADESVPGRVTSEIARLFRSV